MRNKRRLCFVMTVLFVLTIALTGCNSGNKNVENETIGSTNGINDKNFNETGLPIVKEKVTLRIGGAKGSTIPEYETMKYWQKMEDETNVHINWEMETQEAWAEKKALVFSGNDLPDAFIGNKTFASDSEFIQYASQGLIIPLEDLIPKYAPRVNQIITELRPQYEKQMTAPDGHIYGLPDILENKGTTGSALIMNKLWLEKVGMQPPTTLDEFYEVLKAFKGKDLNGNGKDDEIPFIFQNKAMYNGLYTMFGSFGYMDTLEHIIVDNGKVVFTADKPEYKEALLYFRKLIEEGLCDKESLTHNALVYQAKLKPLEPENQTAGCFLSWAQSTLFSVPQPDSFIYLAPLKGKDGKQIWSYEEAGIITKAGFIITPNNKKKEITLRWADRLYAEEKSLEGYYGLEGEQWKKAEDNKIEFIPAPDGVDVGQWNTMNNPRNHAFALLKDLTDRFIVGENVKDKNEVDKFYLQFRSKTMEAFPKILFTNEESQKITQLKIDIVDFVDEQYAKWLLMGGIEEGWDSYVSKLQEANVEEYIKTYQAAYDRYKNMQ